MANLLIVIPFLSMQYLEVKFLCRLTTNASFSVYKGSMLRGSLGYNLRKGLCMARKQNCLDCILAQNCIFQRIFSPTPLNGINRPAPFCLEPELDEKREFASGELFSFNLKLFAYAVDYLPFYVQAFRMAGEKGMGRSQASGRFVIEDILSRGISIYDPENANLNIPLPQGLPNLDEISPCDDNGKLLLHLRTPLRHKSNNHFTASLKFTDILHLILRRIKALRSIEGIDWSLPQKRYALLRAYADEATITDNGLYWHDWTRYSSRQGSYMKFGGLLGRITYQGKLSVFRNFLLLASIAHLGKQTSFGLGRLEFTYF